MKKRKKNNLTIYLAGLLIIATGVTVYFVAKPAPETFTQTEAVDIPFRKRGELIFSSRQENDTLAFIDIEVADNNPSRARGLMYRRSIPENAGMLFIQETEEQQSFWMKNTYIPLDILFVNKEREIVTIHANTTPLKEWNYSSTAPALYVVEVNAGFANRHGIRTGDRISFTLD